MKKQDLWQAVLAQIELNVSPANFATWFKNTEILSKNNEKIVISVPNSFVKEWLENKYQKEILRIIHSLDAKIKKIDFLVNKVALKPSLIFDQQTEQLKLGVFKRDRESGLNPRYVFENFVVGDFNELAHAAATAVSQKPGVLYNPLFVYGPVGLGKTHLMQATGNEVLRGFPKKKTRYVQAERLVSEIVTSIKKGTIEKLKRSYRQIDVLVVDDVQFLAGKEKTQEEFFHIFNTLYQKNKQIILSSDRSPKSIPALAQRLRSRFEGGMIADIGYPDLETRMAILKTKAQERETELREEIYSFLASTIQTNIRELEGALNRIILYQRTRNSEVGIEEAKRLIKDIIHCPEKKITPQKIIKAVAEFYDLKENDIISSSRRKEIVKPRQIAMYLLRNSLRNSYPYIARKFGGKDHTTAIYSCRKVLQEMEKNEELKKEINLIKMRLMTP
jgi:chromosomal replication initiator protein